MQIDRSNNITFGYKVAVDIGASVAGGSFKIKLYNKGDVIDEFSKHLSPGGVKDSQEFVTRIADNIAFMKNMAKNAIEALPTKLERSLEEINLFICGRPEKVGEDEYLIKQIRNIKSLKTGDSLKNVDFSLLKQKFQNTHINAFNDMIGAACAGLNRIPFNELSDSSMFITTGGGCGVSLIRKVKINGDNFIKVSQSRDGRRLINGEPIEVYGASVPALIKNYLSKQNMSDEVIEELLRIGDARIVLNENPELAHKYHLKDSAEATKFAVDRFTDSVAQVVKLRIKDGENLKTVLLSGKLLSGINDFISRDSSMFKYDNLPELLAEKIGAKSPEIKIIQDISDNVEGALFMENKSMFTQTSVEDDCNMLSLFIKQ